MATVHPYLVFPGNTEEVFNFYKSVFGTEFLVLQRFKDMPDGEEKDKMPPEELEKVMHVGLPLSDGYILMGSDGCAGTRDQIKIGGNISLSLQTDSEEETDRIYKALSEGGTEVMPLQKTFWNSYFGILSDKYGVGWMVNYEYK